MSYSAITLPHEYMAAYSAIPVKVFDTDFSAQTQFKYIVNAVYDDVFITTAITTTYQGQLLTKFTTSTPHNYKTGDSILINDYNNNDNLTGYYNIISIVSTTQFIVNVFLSSPVGTYPLRCSKYYKWKLTPDPDGYGKLDMSNVMKDLVSQNLTGTPVNYGLIYDGPDTKKCFGLLMGSEAQYQFNFEDNLFVSGGTVGFYNSSLSSLTGIPFQVGQLIQIQQNPVAWSYSSITNNSGYALYNSNQTHGFTAGQPLTVQSAGNTTTYNGNTTVRQATSSTSLTTWQPFVSTLIQSGTIWGQPQPNYNTTAIITNIYTATTYGVVITTNLAWGGSSPVISGTITYPGSQLPQQLTRYESYNSFCIYNAHINRPDYSITAFDPYVVQSRNANLNKIPTILETGKCYRIEPSTIGFLLFHTSSASLLDGIEWSFYNSSGTLLGKIRLPKNTVGQLDFYAPIGLNQISNTSYIDITGTFSSYSGNVSTYEIYGYDVPIGTTIQRTEKKCFELNNDCSMYEIWHLMWKDQYGSFVSYPFIYYSRDFIESERKSYYQYDGTWEYNTFSYDDYGRGEKTFYSRSKESYTLNSGWLKQFEVPLMKDLIQSTSVYIQTPDNRLYGAQLLDNKLELYKDKQEQIYSYTFNVMVSWNEFRF
jgi:hypothetical protein